MRTAINSGHEYGQDRIRIVSNGEFCYHSLLQSVVQPGSYLLCCLRKCDG